MSRVSASSVRATRSAAAALALAVMVGDPNPAEAQSKVYRRPEQPWCGATQAAYVARLEATLTSPVGNDGKRRTPEEQAEAAIAAHPEVVTNYLDLARCYGTLFARWNDVVRLLSQALPLVSAARNAQDALPASPPDPALPRVAPTAPPIKISDVPPVYPANARAAGISGIVFIDAVIDSGGQVRDARVVGSVQGLDDAARKAVRQWKYQPATDGRLTPVVKLVTVKFGASASVTVADVLDVARFHYEQDRYEDAQLALLEALRMARVGVATEIERRTARERAAAARFGAVPVGGTIREPVKILNVNPVYPVIARAAKVQGQIIIEAVIDEAGNVGDATIVQGIPMLDYAALDAVRQWKYTPTYLDGKPVPVIMTVTVTFSLR